MINEIVPDQVRTAEQFGDDPAAVLLPPETAAIAQAREGRRGEFTTGRACARRALAHFGVPPVAIPHCPDRGPQWPAGFVGSITHCRGYRGAAVARRTDVLSIGIDAEPHAPLPQRVAAKIALPSELAWLREQPPGIHFDTVLFSIKESIYKAWHPLARRWLGFRDALVTISPADATFTVRLLVPAPPCLRGGLSGRYRVSGGLILTATTVAHDPLA